MSTIARYRGGQVAIILTLAVPTLLTTVMFGTDIAMLYFNWLQLQSRADTAALAGAVYLPFNPAVAIGAANRCARLEGIQTDEIVSTRIGSDGTTLTVVFVRRLNLLTPIPGVGAQSLAAKATAVFRSSQTTRGIETDFVQASLYITQDLRPNRRRSCSCC